MSRKSILIIVFAATFFLGSFAAAFALFYSIARSIAETPEFNDSLTVSIAMPGASAAEIEKTLASKFAEPLRMIENVDFVESIAMSDRCEFRLYAKRGNLVDSDIAEIQSQIDEFASRFPINAEQPVISPPTSREKVLRAYFKFAKGRGDSNAAMTELGNFIQENIGKSVSFAKQEGFANEIRLKIDQDQLKKFGINRHEFLQQLRTANLEQTGMQPRNEEHSQRPDISGDTLIEQIGQLEIQVNADKTVPLKNVAEVRLNKTGKVEINGNGACYTEFRFNDSKTANARLLELKKACSKFVSDSESFEVVEFVEPNFPDNGFDFDRSLLKLIIKSPSPLESKWSEKAAKVLQGKLPDCDLFLNHSSDRAFIILRERERKPIEVASALAANSEMPGIQLVPRFFYGNSNVEIEMSPVEFWITHEKSELLAKASKEFREGVASQPILQSIVSEPCEMSGAGFELMIDELACAELGLSTTNLANLISETIYQQPIIEIDGGLSTVKVLTEPPSVDDWKSLRIKSSEGIETTIGSVAKVSMTRESKLIRRINGNFARRYYVVPNEEYSAVQAKSFVVNSFKNYVDAKGFSGKLIFLQPK